MNNPISELAFEDAIEAALLRHGPEESPGTPPRDATDEIPPYGEPGMRPGGYSFSITKYALTWSMAWSEGLARTRLR